MAVCLSILPWVSQAEVPKTISYQGYLFDEIAKKPIDNAFAKLTFSLDGTSWTQTFEEVPVNQGVFAVPLDFSSLDFSKLDPDTIKLGIQADVIVDGQLKIITSPPASLSSVPYAFHAQTVDEATLGKLKCSNGQVPAWNSTSKVWFCSNNVPGPKGDKGDKGPKGDKGDTGPAFSGDQITVGGVCFKPRKLSKCVQPGKYPDTWFNDLTNDFKWCKDQGGHIAGTVYILAKCN